MDFQDFVCEKLKAAGDIKAKKMLGTYNICLDGVNLGVLCVDKWYFEKDRCRGRLHQSKRNIPRNGD